MKYEKPELETIEIETHVITSSGGSGGTSTGGWGSGNETDLTD